MPGIAPKPATTRPVFVYRKLPHLKTWIDRITARDAVKRAYAKIAAINSVRDSATDDARDRYFGRGKYARA
jgi:hypothetical protein